MSRLLPWNFCVGSGCWEWSVPSGAFALEPRLELGFGTGGVTCTEWMVPMMGPKDPQPGYGGPEPLHVAVLSCFRRLPWSSSTTPWGSSNWYESYVKEWRHCDFVFLSDRLRTVVRTKIRLRGSEQGRKHERGCGKGVQNNIIGLTSSSHTLKNISTPLDVHASEMVFISHL